MDTDLLTLAVIAIFAIWFLFVILRYIEISGQKSQIESEKQIFGKILRPETKMFMLSNFPRINSKKYAFVILVATFLLFLVSKLLGIID